MKALVQISCFVFCLFSLTAVWAQRSKAVEVSGSYDAIPLADYTEMEACQICYDQARHVAIVEEFGESRVDRDILTIDSEGNTDYERISESVPNGVWVSTHQKNFESFQEPGPDGENRTYIKCSISGTARLKTGTVTNVLKVVPRLRPNLDTASMVPARNLPEGYIQYEFPHKADFFLEVESAETAYLKVFYTDHQTVWTLFPYRTMPLNNDADKAQSRIQHHTPYLLFYPPKGSVGSSQIRVLPTETFRIDEMYLEATDASNLDKLIVVATEDYIPVTGDITRGPGAFPTMTYSDFIRWLELNKQRPQGGIWTEEILMMIRKP